ncbi:hypothetical protein GGX14DRAFT_390528 [Mycena pura]|uniref:Pheromone receptor n=1 Tax=Mycena pura TaxID=153505 RepID=A0AAD6YFU5_9AGAR|nr:hypothetical protein GGX14DRAFT_390528 [Mycena pura]
MVPKFDLVAVNIILYLLLSFRNMRRVAEAVRDPHASKSPSRDSWKKTASLGFVDQTGCGAWTQHRVIVVSDPEFLLGARTAVISFVLLPPRGPFFFRMVYPQAPVAPGLILLYFVVGFVVQTLFFVRVAQKMDALNFNRTRGLKTRAHKILFIITAVMYLLSAVYWTYCFVNVTARIQVFVDPQASVPGLGFTTLFNALILVNYILSDGVVVWRARLICAPEHRKYMYLPVFIICLTAVDVTALIALRIVSPYYDAFETSTSFASMIDILQLSGLSLSLLSNLTTTGVVGVTAWRHRQAISTGFNKTTQGNRILKLLLESGLLVLASSLIRLPYNTLADLYGPVNIQIAVRPHVASSAFSP